MGRKDLIPIAVNSSSYRQIWMSPYRRFVTGGLGLPL